MIVIIIIIIVITFSVFTTRIINIHIFFFKIRIESIVEFTTTCLFTYHNLAFRWMKFFSLLKETHNSKNAHTHSNKNNNNNKNNINKHISVKSGSNCFLF